MIDVTGTVSSMRLVDQSRHRREDHQDDERHRRFIENRSIC